MARDSIIAGIDIGTSKVSTIITSMAPETPPRVIGVATVESKGLRKGQVVDIEEATHGIVESLEAAERMAGYSITDAFVSIGGSHIASQNSHGIVAVMEPDKEITMQDIERVVEAAKAISLPSSREIIHVLPRGFTVDGQDGIKDPVGMTGVRLEVDTHLITVSSTSKKNIEKCVHELGVNVSGFVFSGLASGEAVLTETEKELGIILVDIGAGTTDISIYVDGALAYSLVLPIGARNITNDIAIGMRVSLESAEKIKLFISHKDSGPINTILDQPADIKKKFSRDEIDMSTLSLPENIRTVTKRTLIDGIIKPRINEIFHMVSQEVKKSGFIGLTPAGLVITGGGAQTTELMESARRVMAMPVRLGTPGEGVTGLIDEILTPSHATVVGLIRYGIKSNATTEKSSFSVPNFSKLAQKMPIKGAAGKLVDLIKSFMP